MLPSVNTTLEEMQRSLGLPEAVARELHRWRTESRYVDVRDELERLVAAAAKGDTAAREELVDGFSSVLPIGTGGRRGPCGVGPNRVSVLLVRETVEALVQVIEAEGAAPKVVVVYDTRRDSRRFAHVAARHMHARGMEVMLVDAPRATPVLSFLVREHGCGGGVVISASHNPPSDNGVKIYGADGAQVLGARDAALTAAIERAASAPLPPLDMNAALPTGPGGVRCLVGAELSSVVDEPYLRCVLDVGVRAGSLAPSGLSVVYTPLHGVGHAGVVPALRARGVEVACVEVQLDPDEGRFSTVQSANPEDPAAFELGLDLARSSDADLVIATDPDADRLGALVKDAAGEFHFVDGNRLGVLMLDHVLRSQPPPPQSMVLTTLVTSPLVRGVCAGRDVEVVDDLLVGFKHHAGYAEEARAMTNLFSVEESHGYVRGDAVRDKDGAMAALLLCECAADMKQQGGTLHDRLREIWRACGYHREKTTSIYARGLRGRVEIERLMAAWRSAAPSEFGGLKVVSVTDRTTPRTTGSVTRDLPGNVLVFELEGDDGACRLVLRPSGTEPKVKAYVLARGAPGVADVALDAQIAMVDALVDRVAVDAVAAAERVMKSAP
jgi:phosphomannomutase